MTPEQLDEQQLKVVLERINDGTTGGPYSAEDISPLDEAPAEDFGCYLVKYDDMMPEMPIVLFGSHEGGQWRQTLFDSGRLTDGPVVQDTDNYYGYVRMRPNYSRELAML